MNLFADESLDRQIVERLRQDGHSVAYVSELSPSISDEEVLQQANDRGALLITADKDFGELVYRQVRVHAGVVLVRLAGAGSSQKADMVAEACRNYAAEFPNNFSVVAPGSVRIRRGP